MQDKPLISVCMLCYNHEKYVAQSIQSIIDQTYRNWELIITDNASTDNSRKIIEEFAKSDKRIKFSFLDYNSYPSVGINNSINYSMGEYIAIISADDYFLPNKLDRQIAFMQEHDLDVSFTWMSLVDSNSLMISDERLSYFNPLNIRNYTDIIKCYLLCQNVTYAPTAMVTKELFNSRLHDNRLLQTQDFELWLRFSFLTKKISILNEHLTCYRILNEGTNLSINKSQATKCRTDFEMIYIFEEMTNLDNNVLSVAINKNVNDNNKLQVLYEYFEANNISLGQFVVLMKIFEILGSDCDVRSDLFQFFFSKYADLDFRNNKVIKEKEEGIKWLEGQVENYKLSLSQKDDELSQKNDELSRIKLSKLYRLGNKLGLIK